MSHFKKEYLIKTDKGDIFYDITKNVEAALLESEIKNGHIIIQPMHTTVGIYLNEAEERLLELDLPREIKQAYPISETRYRHDDILERKDCPEDEPRNGHSHLRSMFCSNPSVAMIASDGKLQIGRYQRLIFAEFDGPCPRPHKDMRKYIVSIIGE